MLQQAKIEYIYGDYRIFRPHFIAVTIELKLSSRIIIPEASFANWVPDNPIDIPTSAFLNAGASLFPSPVTATISPAYLSPVTNKNLSLGVARARTFIGPATPINFYISFS